MGFLSVVAFLLVIGMVQTTVGLRPTTSSDDCDVLHRMGYDVFRCATSAYPTRDECVPRGRRGRRRPAWQVDPMNRVCDSKLDCTDGSDELLPECVSQHREYCENDLEKEVDGEYLEAFRCFGNDGENDLVKSSSLSSSPSSSSMCVSECQMCDGTEDCPNGADELPKNCRKMRPTPPACQLF